MHADEVFDEAHLPLRYVGLSHCFRTEAGAAGRASRGLYRVHQFTKVEMFAYATPETSGAIHQEILALEEEIFTELGIPYRVLDICSGDLGGPAYRKFDLEAWMPGRGEAGEYGEVTSTSDCTDYQARRLNIRYKPTGQKGTRFVHTLNGTAVALSRALIVVLENYQRADGLVDVPEVLRPYIGKDVIGSKTPDGRGQDVRMRNELTIRGEPSELAKLIERIDSARSDAWSRDRDLEERLWRPRDTEPSTYCFTTPAGTDLPPARLLVEICTNGLCIDAGKFRKIHLGGRQDEGIIKVSADTEQKRLAVVTAEARDSVATFLDKDFVLSAIRDLEEKSGKPIADPAATVEAVGKALNFSEASRAGILASFIQGGQVTAGGVLQAVTAYAQQVEDPDVAYDLESNAVAALELAYAS